jgi:uncharacterized repeat protein (TIGR01451 family)
MKAFQGEKQKLVLVCTLAWLASLSAALGILPSQQTPLPNYDKRPGASTGVQAARGPAIAQLRSRLPAARVSFDRITGSPAWVRATDGFLSGPGGQGRGIAAASLAAVSSTESNRATRAFLSQNAPLFGYGPEILDTARIAQEFVTPQNGLRTVVWEQQLDGIAVFEARLISHTTKNGELVSVASHFIRAPAAAADRGTPARAALEANPGISAADAIARAAQDLGETLTAGEVTPVEAQPAGPERRQHFHAPGLNGEAGARLNWLPMDDSTMRLCWQVILVSHNRGEMFEVLIDAVTGEALVRHGLTNYSSDASYRVYTSDSPSPFSPGYSTPTSSQPLLVARSLLTLTALDTNASPNGWIDDGVNQMTGNNVDAHTDWNDDDQPDLPRPVGSPFRIFDYPMDLGQEPSTYSNAAVAQLFYWNNFMHDKLYELGFTEAAGNFQNDNFGKGGLGNDAVQADAQDSAALSPSPYNRNNANFSTPPDGSPGRMQMYLFTGPAPDRDGDLDAEVVLHEYTHGLSNRRVGGGVGIGELQSSGMGEGWSDFYALSLLSEPGDDVNGVYAAGGYASYLLGGLTQNYYFGIRRYPYCTDMNKNPLTFRDIDPAQASAHSGIPRNPVIGTSATEVHNMGEVWCVTLWDARANLIASHGWAVGNQLMLQLVTDGMNLSPADPNFLQARDAILQADQVDNAGANLDDLWAAFAKRGMGFSATSPDSSTTTGIHESFDVPDDLQVSPTISLNFSGVIGGPFNPSCKTCLLTNIGTNALTWIAQATQPWLSVTPAFGSLPAGSSTNADVCLNAAAMALPVGYYTASLTFSNTISGVRQVRDVTLRVSPPQVLFFPLDTDPGWSRQGPWAFGQPAGLGGSLHGYPDPTGGATGSNVFGINLSGDYSTALGGPYYLKAGPFNFSGYTGVALRFQRWLNTDYPPFVYATIEISTNGTTWSGIWTNGPDETADDDWSSVYYDLSTYADNQTNVYVRWGHYVGASGAYAYSGWNIDDVEFLGFPPLTLSLVVPTNAAEGDGVLSGTVTCSLPPGNDLVVTLSSSDTSEVTVPQTVTIPAGETSASFNLTIVDDAILDGTQTATITASAPGATSGIAGIAVADNETAGLRVALPATVTEGQGTVPGTVEINAVPASDVSVSLSSSDTTAIQVPASVIVPSGQTSAVFVATVVDDTRIDGPQLATVVAHVTNWTDGATNITVLDNENTNLTVTLPGPVSEGAGTLTNSGLAGISGTLPTNLVVSLVSADPARLNVPGTATILAGQTNAPFDLGIVDNVVPDGAHAVLVSASADGFAGATGTLTILDNDADHFTLSAIASPQTSAVPFSVTITARDATNGIVSAFEGPVTLSAAGDLGPASLAPTSSGLFSAGQWTGSLTVNSWDTNVVLTAADGSGHTGASNPFEVVRPASVFIPAANRTDMVQDTARGLLYITDGDRVLRYDLGRGLFLPPYIVGSNLCGIDLSPDNNTLVVADASGYSSSNVWAYAVDLPTGTNQQITFTRESLEGGTYAVAFGNDGAALISSTFLGSGFTPLRRYDPATGNVTIVAHPSQNQMLSSSGDGHIIGVVEANISSGPLDRYDVASRTFTGTANTSWFMFEVGVNRNGTQFAAPTYGGTFIYDDNLTRLTTLGTYASEGPIGLSYHPQADLVFFAWWPTSYIRAYETHTWAEVARYDCGYNFQWTGNWAFGQGRLRTRDGNNLFVTVNGGVRWISRPTSPPADLALDLQGAPDPVNLGGYLTYTIAVTNHGPNAVTDARVFDRLPAGVTFVSADSPQGNCIQSNGLITCTFDPLASGASAVVTIGVVPTSEAILTNTAAIVSSAVDSVAANNAATLQTTVLGGASLAVSPATDLISTGQPGGPFAPSSQVYTLTNSGTEPLPWMVTKTADWVSLSASNGTLAPASATTVTVAFGSGANSLPPGDYSDVVTFLNTTNDVGSTSRNVELAISVTPPCASAPSGLIGWWRAEGNADDSIGGDDGFITNGATYGPGEVGQAFSFDGLSGYAGIPQTANLNPGNQVTIEFWMKPDAANPLSNYQGLVTSDFYGIEVSDGINFVVSTDGGATFAETKAANGGQGPLPAAGQWHHVAGTYDGSKLQLYVDGLPAGNSLSHSGTISPMLAASFMAFGSEDGRTTCPACIGTRYFHGLIDEVGIYNRALSPAEIAAIYGAGVSGKCTPSPDIAVQPANQMVPVGGEATFAVSATGLGSLSYQWRKDGVNLVEGGRIAGATGTNLAISSALQSDSGRYSVIVTNAFGSVTSSNALLLVNSLDHFAWNSIPTSEFTNVPIPVTIQAQDAANQPVTNFNWPVALSGWIGAYGGINTILGGPDYLGAGSGDYTLGYAFTPNTNITVTHVRHYFGTKVSIWKDDGTLLAAQNVTSVPGTWVETPLDTPVELTAGTTYRVGAYTGGGDYYYHLYLTNTFADGTIDQSYQSFGDAFPNGGDGIAWWFVDLRYSTAVGVAVPVLPIASDNFVQGLWSGSVLVPGLGTNLVLRADDGFGHFGLANPINLLLVPSLQSDYQGNVLTLSWPADAPGFVVETSTNLSSGSWILATTPTVLSNNQYLFQVQTSNSSRFYRLRFSPP